MEVEFKSSKSEAVFVLRGIYSSDEYHQILQRLADTSAFGKKKLVFDFTQLTGFPFRIAMLCLLIAHSLNTFQTTFLLSEDLEPVKKWFEPFWSTVINEGKSA